MISCALLGFGRIGQFHYQTILKHKDKFKLKCIIDPKVNFNLLIPVIHPKDLKQTLEKYDIRAIFVCSPTKYHFDAIQCALSMSIHVFVEKPVCTKRKNITTLYSLAKEKKCVLLCGLNRRFDNDVILMKQVYERNKKHIQQILIVSRDYPSPPPSYIKQTDSFFSDSVIHDIDKLLFITNETPNKIISCGSKYSRPAIKYNKLDNITTLLCFPSGLKATLINSRQGDFYEQRIEMLGCNEHMVSNVKSDGFLSRYRKSYENELIAFL